MIKQVLKLQVKVKGEEVGYIAILQDGEGFHWMWKASKPGILSKAGQRGFANPQAALGDAVGWVAGRFEGADFEFDGEQIDRIGLYYHWPLGDETGNVERTLEATGFAAIARALALGWDGRWLTTMEDPDFEPDEDDGYPEPWYSIAVIDELEVAQ